MSEAQQRSLQVGCRQSDYVKSTVGRYSGFPVHTSIDAKACDHQRSRLPLVVKKWPCAFLGSVPMLPLTCCRPCRRAARAGCGG
jgi:hypothetical protein